MGAKSKRSEAADVWRLMSMCLQRRFGRTAGMLPELGLTPGDMKALLLLQPDEPRPMSAVAASFGCDASTVTWLVDRLEERALVKRQAAAGDRRVKTVVLTARGCEVKELLERDLYEPPPEILALERSTLAELRAAFEATDPT